MPRHCILTEQEFQLMMASVRCEKIPGLEELTLTTDTKIGLDARSGLIGKKLLTLNENGHYSVERTSGYIFSALGRCSSWVRGDILYPDGQTARLNLYLLNDVFESILWRSSDSLECTWMSNYPLAMGSILHCLNHPGKGMPSTQRSAEDTPLHSILTQAQQEIPDGVTAAFAFSEHLSPNQNDVHFYIAARNGRFYSAYADKNKPHPICKPMAELVKELAEHIFNTHQAEVAEGYDGQN